MDRRPASSLSPRAAVPRRRRAVFSLLALALAAAVVIAASLGAYPLGPGDAAGALAALLAGDPAPDPEAATVLFAIRLPRIGAALLLGGALAAAGAVYQQIFRNPLVSPDILGVSAGAGLGAVLGIFLSLPVFGIQLLAFVGGLGAVALVMLIASAVRRHDSVLVLVLSGIVIGALASSVTSLLKVLADPYDQLPAITFWLLGSLAAVSIRDVVAALPAVMLALVPLVLLRWKVDVLAMGDEEARALGVDVGRVRALLIICATLVTAAVVSFAGMVGWVGLIIPHFARMLVGPGFVRLLPASMLVGCVFMLVVDTLARSVAVTEVPLGILTAVIGAPIFVFLLARSTRIWS